VDLLGKHHEYEEAERMQESSTFQLVVGQGPKPGQVFELPRSTVSIGRDPGNQVVINDPQISRQHARITPQGGLMILEDLGSTNGTMVNGLRITGPHTLAHGDQIGLGDNVTLNFYGRPVSDAGDTMVAPRMVYSTPPPAAPAAARQPPASVTYEEAIYADYQSTAPEYAPSGAPDYEDYEYYEEYPEETGRNWTLVSLGCILVAIIIGLLIAIFIYFFAPASIVDPIADFLAGFGINVP
jgi:pSer/pThr/pTyr-binding forkhead associated (FHA) protein